MAEDPGDPDLISLGQVVDDAEGQGLQNVVDVATLQGKPVPHRRWLIEDWVPWGTVTALYGDGGVGKSLLAQQLITCAAARSPFLSLSITACKAMGVFCEDDAEELHRRQYLINQKLDIDFADLDGLFWVSRVADDNLLMTFEADGRGRLTDFANELTAACRDKGVQLVVIDTAADTFGGNENNRPQVRQFLSAGLARLARDIDGAVILLAHPSLTGLSTGQGSGGSTAWNNSVRSRLYLSRRGQTNGEDTASDDGGEGDDDVRVLARKKSNYARAGDELRIRYEDGAFVALDAPEETTQLFAQSQRNMADREFIRGIRVLREQGIRVNLHKNQANYAPRAIREKVDGAAEFTMHEFTQAMNRLIKAKRVRSVDTGSPSRPRTRLVVSEDEE